MARRFYHTALCPHVRFLRYGLLNVFFFLYYHCTAGLAFRHVAQQRQTALDVSTNSSSSSAVVAAGIAAFAQVAVDPPKSENSWLCRISRAYEACGTREYLGVDPPQSHMYCPDKFCCSKTACMRFLCGSWCTDSWALCSSKIVYHPEWSYGNCNCKRLGHKCHENAECVHKNEANGGAYCSCRTGFVGDGKNCSTDFCVTRPCLPGDCRNEANGYECTCPSTHTRVIVDNRELCKEKTDYCVVEPCGPPFMVESCTNTEDGYQCTCQQGYEVRNKRCEEIDLCTGSPCGPLDAVHSCITERRPKFRYRCQCKNGYELRLLPNGEDEVCTRNWCAGNPCGDANRVASCSSKENGYSCLCKHPYIVHTDTHGKEKCVKGDVCKDSPCGPPNAAKRCYAEESGYRCECQPGYVELNLKGKKTCLEGDPCLLQVCGTEEKVAECSTYGSNYTCTCREPDYLLGMHDGHKTCLSKKACTENCGPLKGVKLCAVNNGTYTCTCNEGYVTLYRGKTRTCAEQDVCALAPCGPEEAVENCAKNTTGGSSPYSCTCKTGYEVRTLEDSSEVCVHEESCVGNPCGPPEIVKACITENNRYSCHCAEDYTQGFLGGRRRCLFVAPTQARETKEVSENGSGSLSGNQSGNVSGVAIAGSVAGGLSLLGLVGAGVAYARKGNEEDDEESAADDSLGEQLEEPPSPAAVGQAPVLLGHTSET